MDDYLLLLLQICAPLILVAIGLIVGTVVERKHYQSIRSREKANLNLPLITLREYQGDKTILKSHLVTGSVVVSVDYFKRFLAALRNLFGGQVLAYESLVDRARREAILRMKANCPEANIIINLKIETSSISKQSKSGPRAVGCVEAIAYGTAIQLH